MNNYLLMTSKGAWQELLRAPLKAIHSYTLFTYYKESVVDAISSLESANQSLYRKYGHAEGNMLSVDPKSSNYQDFLAEQKELYNGETEIKPFENSLLDLLESADEFNLSAAYIELLTPFFKTEVKKRKKAA